MSQNNRLLFPNAGGKTQLVLYTTKSGTFNPTIVASDTSGIMWDFGDGSATYTGGTPSHSYADSSQKTVRITFDDPTLVTQMNFVSMSLVGILNASAFLPFTALASLFMYNSAGFDFTGVLSDLPSSLTDLRLLSTGSTLSGNIADAPAELINLYLQTSSIAITGDIADAPAGLKILHCATTASAITGDIADAPSSMTNLLLSSSSSNVGGGTTAMAAVGIREIQLGSSSTTQANIDDILARLYADRASFTYATPALNVGGTNPNPTGTYADATPPTTGLEYAYKLVNDPDTEGFNTWTITY